MATPEIFVYDEADDVSTALCDDFVNLAQSSIADKGAFYCAISGGASLQLLKRMGSIETPIDWSKVYVYYVSDKSIGESGENDPTSAHSKAKSAFLDKVGIPESNVYPMIHAPGEETSGHNTEAHNYQKKIAETVPSEQGVPVFDYIVVNVGKDGRVGGLLPQSKEVELKDKKSLVVPIDTKGTPSLSFSLELINAARAIRVPLTTADKAETAKLAILKAKSCVDFPAAGVSDRARWLLDTQAATRVRSLVEVNVEQ
jgi:6-phosphogluconolactonase